MTENLLFLSVMIVKISMICESAKKGIILDFQINKFRVLWQCTVVFAALVCYKNDRCVSANKIAGWLDTPAFSALDRKCFCTFLETRKNLLSGNVHCGEVITWNIGYAQSMKLYGLHGDMV